MWNICRTCMSKEVEMISIFDQGKSPSISAMILTISSLEFLPNDRLPSEICSTCFETLELTYYFKKQVTKCNDVLQKQTERSTLLARCKLLTQHQVNKEMAENREDEEVVSNEHIEYVQMVSNDAATENVADHSSECRDPLSLKLELPLTNVAHDDLPEESSSDYIKDVNSQFEGTIIKSESVEVEEHGVQFGDNCGSTQSQIKPNNVTDDDAFCSDDDLPLPSLHESTGSYNTSQMVDQYSNENTEVTSEASEGLKKLRDLEYLSSDKSFKCTYCNKLFDRESKLKCHMYIHKKPRKCEICEKLFDCPSRLKIHMRKHTGERPFKCQHCNATFSQACTLKGHIRLHTGEVMPKPHKCEDCGKAFRMSCHLKVHIRSHTDERPFPCQYCNSKFKTKGSLKDHTRLHTGEAAPKPHKCEVCGESFVSPSRLKQHMRKHSFEVLHNH